MHELEKDVEPLAQVPAGSALIIDGMAFIHQIHTMLSTLDQLADILKQYLMHMAIQCRCPKNCERRAMGSTQVIHITRPDQKTPKQFNKSLANGRNKELLKEFLFQCWTWYDHPERYATL